MAKEIVWEPGLTYKDFYLLPGMIRSGVTVDSIDLKAPLTKYVSRTREVLGANDLEPDVFTVNIPMLSAPMQAVTGPKMSIELAKTGGLGVIYCSQPVESQTQMIKEVKKYKAGSVEPDVVSPETRIADLSELMQKKGYHTFPVTENGNPKGKLLGLITRNDFSQKEHQDRKVAERMIPLGKLVYALYEEVGYDLRKANEYLIESHHGSIPIVDRNLNLQYMVFRKDIEHHRENPLALVDDKKRYKVGAAVNTHDYKERVPALVEAGSDILFIDSSQGYSEYQGLALGYVLKNFPGVPVIGGNVVTEDGFDFLVKNGAYGVKIGMGPGSICTTKEKFRIGRAQATAVIKISERRKRYFEETGVYIPINADGGIVTNDDVWIALALRADTIMGGRFFARFDESPTGVQDLTEIRDGRTYTAQVKPYWGEGSERAKRWREKRYAQADETEGVEGWVPYAGYLRDGMPRVINSIRIVMQKNGFADIYEIHNNSVLERESESSRSEGRPHDIGMPGLWSAYSVW